MTSFAPQGRQEFNSGGRGKEPRLTLTLDGREVLFAERYQVKLGILTQPAAFSLTLGTASDLAKLIRDTPPNTIFDLRIDERLVMRGALDGHGSQGAASSLTVQGRDVLAPLHDPDMLQEQSFKDDTYLALVRKVLDSVGLEEASLVTSNDENRTRLTGKKTRLKGPSRDVASLQVNDASTAGGAIKKHVQSQLGEKAYEFCKRHLDRAGLFLWAGADGQFILSEPNPNQVPLYRIQRSEGWTPEFSDVVDHEYKNDTVGRFTEIHVYTRGETKKTGRGATVAVVRDSEMALWGFERVRVLRDANADTLKKAEYMGRRKMAESRRQGWRLSYTVKGHTTGSPLGGTVVWAPDTVVEVDDKHLGIDGVFWIEAVTFNGAPQATTVVELMRPRDLIFGDAPT